MVVFIFLLIWLIISFVVAGVIINEEGVDDEDSYIYGMYVFACFFTWPLIIVAFILFKILSGCGKLSLFIAGFLSGIKKRR